MTIIPPIYTSADAPPKISSEHPSTEENLVESLGASPDDLTPQEIVEALNKNIVGQQEAKRAVAIALRDRWRRRRLEDPMRTEIVPKNILMIGPTGCGKTEIARRLARLVHAPFLKVEATRFTEVGYVGRDVEQIIRDLTEQAVQMEITKQRTSVEDTAQHAAEQRLLSVAIGKGATSETQALYLQRLRNLELENQEIEIELEDQPNNNSFSMDIPGFPKGQVGMVNIGEQLGKMFGSSPKRRRRVTVKEARTLLLEEEIHQRIDKEKATQIALTNTEQNGIVFIDEIDKVASRRDGRAGDVSREGVQRDLLPLIEGAAIQTRHGIVNTNHILFIASGAFHQAKPSDLMPELQGRLPIRVTLKALTQEDFLRILREPQCNLPSQYVAMMATEGVDLQFTSDSLEAIAHFTTSINTRMENIGARRLHTLMERLLEDISFTAATLAQSEQNRTVVIDASVVHERLTSLGEDHNLSRFIL